MFLSSLGAIAALDSNSGKMTMLGYFFFFFFAVDSDSEGNVGFFIQGLNRDYWIQ